MMAMKRRFGRACVASTGKRSGHVMRKMRAKGDTEVPPEEKLLRAIFGDKGRTREVVGGRVIPPRAPKGGDTRDTPVRKATTFRLEVVLGGLLKQPLNRLVNEAVRGFLEKRSAEIEADLERTLQHLKAYRKKDPSFESAIQQFVDAEARACPRDGPQTSSWLIGTKIAHSYGATLSLFFAMSATAHFAGTFRRLKPRGVGRLGL
jgi:hypothetical protein